MVELDYERLDALAEERREAFATAEPYPFTVIDDFLPAEDAEQTLAEFEATESGWNHYHHYNEKKLALTDIRQMGAHTQQVFHALEAREFVDFVETLTGIEGLISDPARRNAAEAFLKAEATAHAEAERMVKALAQNNWDVGTPAYQAANVAMKDMITAAARIIETA